MDFLDVFGLQVILEDHTSANAQRIQQSLNNLGVTVDNVEHAVMGSFMRMESIMHSGFQINLWGQRITAIGVGIEKLFTGVGKKVLDVSAGFETQRMKLDQLYGDVREGGKVFDYAVQQALKTPFAVKEYVSAINGLKVSGVDPLKQFLNERTGKMQDMIQFAGDLAGAFGKNMNDAFFSLKEAVAGNSFVSLKRRFDGLSKDVIEATTGMKMATGATQKDIEQRAEVMAKFIGMKYGGMMAKLGTTFTGLLSRVKENFDIFWYEVGSAGFFKEAKDQILKLLGYIEGNQPKMKQFAKVVSDSLITILRPLAKVMEYGVKIVGMFSSFATAHPALAKIITVTSILAGGFLILAGAIVAVSGSLITMIASLATLALNMRMSHGSTRMSAMLFQGFGKVMIGLTASLMKYALVSAIIATAWKYNIGGIKTTMIELSDTTKEAFKAFQHLTSLNLISFLSVVKDMQSSGGRVNNFALGLAKAYYVIAGIVDYLGDGKVMEDTVRRLDALGALGFLESFIKFDIAIRSIVKGISEHLVGVFNLLKPPVLWVIDKLNYMITLFNKLFNRDTPTLFSNEGGQDFTGKMIDQKWELVGRAIGVLIGGAIASMIVKRVTGTIKTLSSLNRFFKNTSAIALLGHGNIRNGGQILTRNVLTRQGRNLAQTGQWRNLTWFNLALAKTGLIYQKVANSMTTLALRFMYVGDKLKLAGGAIATTFNKFIMSDLVKKISRLSVIMSRVATGRPLSRIPRRDPVTGRFVGASQAGEWRQFKAGMSKFFKQTINPVYHIRNARQSIINRANASTHPSGQQQPSVTNVRQAGARLAGNFVSGLMSGLMATPIASKIAGWIMKILPFVGLLLQPEVLVAVLVGFIITVIAGIFSGNEIATKFYEGFIGALEWAVALLIAGGWSLWKIGEKIDEWWNGVKQRFHQILIDFGIDVMQNMAEFGRNMGKRFNELIDMFVQFAKDFPKHPIQALLNLNEKFLEWVNNVGKDIKDFAVNMVESMRELGHNVGKAFGEGLARILDPWNGFWDRVKTKANDAITWINKKTGSSIPTIPFESKSKSTSSKKSTNNNTRGSKYGGVPMSTGGQIRSAGTFLLHEGEAVVNDTKMNAFDEGIRGLRSIANRTNADAQRSNGGGQTIVQQDTRIDKIEVVLPSVKQASPDELTRALKDPSVVQVLKQVISQARSAEAVKGGKQITPTFGVARV